MNSARGAGNARRTVTVWVVSVALAATLVICIFVWFRPSDGKKPIPLTTACTASVEGRTSTLAPDQTANAALLASVADRRGLPPRAVTIAIAVAMQESKMRNISYGDMDSVGMFQQRPSQGWGTREQLQDPIYAANAFYEHLARVPNYLNLPITEAGQAVQRSAYPEAYAQHEALARAFASALTGYSPAALNCTFKPASSPGTTTQLMTELTTDFGPVEAAQVSSTVVTVPSSNDAASTVLSWAIAHWSVAHAEELSIESVSFQGKVWNRNDTDAGSNVGWQADANVKSGVVTISIKAA